MSNKSALAVAFGFMIGGLLMTWYEATYVDPFELSYGSIAECAVGQDLDLRETKGVARFRVTFKDSEYQEIECISDQEEG